MSGVYLTPTEKSNLITTTVLAVQSTCQQYTRAKFAKDWLISPRHFSRLFYRAQRVSFGRYVLSLRLLMAAKLLRETDATIQSISEKVGYRHRSSFNQAFRRMNGVCPSAYREGGRK